MPGAESKTDAPAFCLACQFSLAGLTAGLCPECGQRFDPADPTTFSTAAASPPWLRRCLALIAVLPMLAHAMIYACALGARVVLGRWPNPGMPDDPGNIAELRVFHVATLLIFYSSLPLVAAGYLVACVTERRNGERTTRMLRTLMCASVLLFFVIPWFDPWRVYKWFFWD